MLLQGSVIDRIISVRWWGPLKKKQQIVGLKMTGDNGLLFFLSFVLSASYPLPFLHNSPTVDAHKSPKRRLRHVVCES